MTSEGLPLSERLRWVLRYHREEHGPAAEYVGVVVHARDVDDWTREAAALEAEVARLRAALGKTTRDWCGFFHAEGTMQAGCDYCRARGEPVPGSGKQPHDLPARDAWWADYEEAKARAKASVVHAPDCPVALAQGGE